MDSGGSNPERLAGIVVHSPKALRAEERSALGEAVEFLREELSDGPVMARSVKERSRRYRTAKRTLMRAKSALKVAATRKATRVGRGVFPARLRGRMP